MVPLNVNIVAVDGTSYGCRSRVEISDKET